jgi:hypothetical protein
VPGHPVWNRKDVVRAQFNHGRYVASRFTACLWYLWVFWVGRNWSGRGLFTFCDCRKGLLDQGHSIAYLDGELIVDVLHPESAW